MSLANKIILVSGATRGGRAVVLIVQRNSGATCLITPSLLRLRDVPES